MIDKKAFTLIELLVVVLIIGVLAAVALPQYQTAINKSRYAGLMPLAKSVKDAEEEIMMTKADYTADLGDLAVTPGTIDPENTSTATHGHVNLSVVAGADEGQDYVKAVDGRNIDNTFVMYFAKSPRYGGEIHCEAKTSNAKAQQLCKSYGPINTVTGTDGDYTTYVLQGSGADAGALSGGGYNWTDCDDEYCYAYDQHGNQVAGCYYSEDPDDCEIAWTATYDANGHQTSYDNPGERESWTATYDENGHKISGTSTRGDDYYANSTATYDEQGNLESMIVDSAYDDEDLNESYTYDANNRVATIWRCPMNSDASCSGSYTPSTTYFRDVEFTGGSTTSPSYDSIGCESVENGNTCVGTYYGNSNPNNMEECENYTCRLSIQDGSGPCSFSGYGACGA